MRDKTNVGVVRDNIYVLLCAMPLNLIADYARF